jgi:hypothetical protein
MKGGNYIMQAKSSMLDVKKALPKHKEFVKPEVTCLVTYYRSHSYFCN